MICFVDAAFLLAFTQHDIQRQVLVFCRVFLEIISVECLEIYELISTQKYFGSVVKKFVKTGFKIPSYQKSLLMQNKAFPMYHQFLLKYSPNLEYKI